MVCVWEPIPHKEISQNDYCGETRECVKLFVCGIDFLKVLVEALGRPWSDG